MHTYSPGSDISGRRSEDTAPTPVLEDRPKLPTMLVAVTAAAVVGSVALTVVAGPLYGYATRAAEALD